jgi:hypothetical protein
MMIAASVETCSQAALTMTDEFDRPLLDRIAIAPGGR